MEAKILKLEKQRDKLYKELHQFDTDEEAYTKKYQEIVKVVEQIKRIENERFISTIRSGLIPFGHFLQSDFQLDHFTPTVYRLLNCCFDNIAHYDRNGFYLACFSSDEQIIRTLEYMVNFITEQRITGELESEIQEMISESGILPRLKQKRVETKILQEKQELKRLLDKYYSGELPEEYRGKT